MLMLSTCFPDPQGSAKAARAWRLLRCAAKTHRVFLSAVADCRVNLNGWRDVAGCVQRIHIVAPKRFGRFTSPCTDEARDGFRHIAFDALLANEPGAWPTVFPGRIASAVCDFAHCGQDEIALPEPRTPELLSLLGLKPKPIRLPDVIAACDHVLVDSIEQASALASHRYKAVITPDDDLTAGWSRLYPQPRLQDTDPIVPSVTILHTEPSPLRQAA